MRWKMKKVLGMFLICILLACGVSVALAKEIIVQLNVPGCSAWGSNARIGSVLRQIEGVKKHKNKGNDILIVTFDDEKVTINVIIDELKKGKYSGLRPCG